MAVAVNKTYQLGDFSIEVDRRELLRAGARHHLASRPFQVLLYLIEHRGRFVARSELLERFWNGKDVYDETLTKCVGAIRKALDDRQDSPRFIETRYAEGYRYIGPFEDCAAGGIVIATEQRRDVRIVIEEEEVQLPEPPQQHSPSLPVRAAPANLWSTKTSPRVITLALVLIVTVMSAGALLLYRNRTRSPATTTGATVLLPINSVAVLPLRNLSNNPTEEYFSDGLTESFISALSRIKGLKVISRNSVIRFKDKDVDPQEIGQKLGVDAILEGSVRQTSDKVRVEARLVSTRDGSVLWASESNSRGQGDILDIQDEITRGVLAGLRVRLGTTDQQRLAKRETVNPEAYRAYLKGRHFWNQRTTESMQKAIQQFEQAIQLDQSYALAYVGLGQTYAVMEVNSLVPPRTAAPKAQAYAGKALALDDEQAGAYAALGLLASLSDWNFPEGERFLERALALNPNYATAHHWYANTLLAQGKFAQAESELKHALELDPLSYPIANSLSETYYYWRQYDRCLAQAEKISEMHPDKPPIYSGRCHWQQGRYTEALTDFQRSGSTGPDLEISRAVAAGQLAEARRMIDAEAGSKAGTISPYNVAGQYALVNDKDAAFAWLEKAYAAHQADLVSVKIEPIFDSIRSDPRFDAFVSRIGLAD